MFIEQITNEPTAYPTEQPWMYPTIRPTATPSTQPTSQPTDIPSKQPTISTCMYHVYYLYLTFFHQFCTFFALSILNPLFFGGNLKIFSSPSNFSYDLP